MDHISESRLSLVSKHAAQYGLDPALVCAVCEQESAWNQWSVRYEAAFFESYIQPLLNNNTVHGMTEAKARSTSFGLMQVMGQVAREFGFQGRFLTELCDPEVGLDIGCRVLKAKLDAAKGDVHNGLQRYNGGGDPSYADEVVARLEKYREQ